MQLFDRCIELFPRPGATLVAALEFCRSLQSDGARSAILVSFMALVTSLVGVRTDGERLLAGLEVPAEAKMPLGAVDGDA